MKGKTCPKLLNPGYVTVLVNYLAAPTSRKLQEQNEFNTVNMNRQVAYRHDV